jgi:release factor glutamine methyltransferase
VESAPIEAEVLLRHAAGLDRAALYAHWTQPVAETIWVRYVSLLEGRAAGRPTAYLVGEREFYGLSFHVDDRVLIPRPETELLVDTALRDLRDVSSPVIADVGTGSGALAVTLAVRRADAAVYATDVSEDALNVARLNARRHGVIDRMHFLAGDALAPLLDRGVRVEAIVANPPYVPPHARGELPAEIRDHEPAVAVFAPGPRGTEVHERVAVDALQVLVPGGLLVLEVAAKWEQASRVAAMLQQAGYRDVRIVQDLAELDRAVCARSPH